MTPRRLPSAAAAAAAATAPLLLPLPPVLPSPAAIDSSPPSFPAVDVAVHSWCQHVPARVFCRRLDLSVILTRPTFRETVSWYFRLHKKYLLGEVVDRETFLAACAMAVQLRWCRNGAEVAQKSCRSGAVAAI